MTNAGKYKSIDEKKKNFTYKTSLTLSQKMNFVMEVAGMVVSSDFGYAHVLRNAIYNYCIIKYFTDIVLFENTEEFNLDILEKFCEDNRQSVLDTVKNEIGDLSAELCKACDEAIEYRKLHFSGYKEEVSDLLQVVREFVVKPDYMNEMLGALTNYLNKASEREIDTEAFKQIEKLLPVWKDMNSKDVAKAVIEQQSEKPKKKAGRPKKKVEEIGD